MNLLTLSAIAGAITQTVSAPVKFSAPPRSLAVQANFAYGSGGTSVDAYLQTSLDGGATWIDIAQFHLTTASARFVYNLNSQTPVATEYTPTDGALAANTAKDGILGPQLRVKYGSTGAYAGATSLSIDIACDQACGV
jgi:hypothetical protein